MLAQGHSHADEECGDKGLEGEGGGGAPGAAMTPACRIPPPSIFRHL